jgi:hypothetical protein
MKEFEFNPNLPEEKSFYEHDFAPAEGGQDFSEHRDELERFIALMLFDKAPTDKLDTIINVLQAMCLTWQIKITVSKRGTLIFTDIQTGKKDYYYPEEVNKYL